VDRKSLGRVEIKDADDDKGTFTALIATFNAKDSDGDVTLPGAFPEGKGIPVSSYGHTSWEGALPIGSAVLTQTRTEGLAKGRFYLDTPHGNAAYTTLKRLSDDGHPSEWSYGYAPKEFNYGDWDGETVRFLKAVDVFEASPVLKGAGIGTRTLDIKRDKGSGVSTVDYSYKGVIGAHDCATVVTRWVPAKALHNLGLGATILDLRAVHAFVDPTQDPTMKSSYHFLHHDAPGAPANLRACYLGIAALNGAKGFAVPEAARAGVYDHLASHIRDAGREAPELRQPGERLKMREETMVLLAQATDLTGRLVEVGASRVLKRERSITAANQEVLTWLREELAALDALLDSPDETAKQLKLQFIRNELLLSTED